MKSVILSIVIILLFAACHVSVNETYKCPLSNFKGGIIHQKYLEEARVEIKDSTGKKSIFIYVETSPWDLSRFKIGDTIK